MTSNEAGEYSTATLRRNQTAANDMMSTLTEAVRENPVSAALIGMGALWLFMGGGSMSLLGGRHRSSVFGAVARGAGTVAHGAGEMAHSTADAVSRMGSSVASGVSSAAGSVAETVTDTAAQVGDYVSGSLHGTDAEEAYRNPRFSDERNGLAASPFTAMQDMFERHPLMLGAAGLALGAGIAASLPLTSTERDTLGKANETVRSKLGEAGEQVREMASAVADEIRQGTGPGHGPG